MLPSDEEIVYYVTTVKPISDINAKVSTSKHSQETEEPISEEHCSQKKTITDSVEASTSRSS